MPRAKLPKRSKIDIAKPKKSKILISTPVKSKIDIRKKKETKILMPEALRAHMLEKEANRLYMRDMKKKNIEYKTEDKTEKGTEVDMFVVRGIPTAQGRNLPQRQNKPNKARVPTVNGVPVTVPVPAGAKSSRAKAPVVNDVPVIIPVVNDGPVIVPAGPKSGSFRKRPKKLGNTRTPIKLENTRTPIELPQPILADIVTLNAPKPRSKKQNKIAPKPPRKPNIAPKPPALATSPIEQPRLQNPISLPKPSPPKPSPPKTRTPLSQMQPEHQKVEINRPPQRRKLGTRVTTNILPQAFNTKKAVDKVIKIQTVRRAQEARKATERARVRKEELERKERERKEREIEQKRKATKIQAVFRGHENNYEPYTPYKPFNPEPVGRVSYVPYGQTENNVLEKLEMANTARRLLIQLEVGNRFTDIFGDRTPAKLVENVLDEKLSNNPIEVQEQLHYAIETLAQAATNIQTKYRGKKSRRNFNKLKRKKESSKMLKNLGRFQKQKLILIKQLVSNQLVKGKDDKKLNMKMKAKVLGLDIETATKRDIESAYRKLSRLYHPNKNPNMDPSKIKKFFLIKEARNYLLRDVNEPSRTLDLQNTTLKPLALQYKPKNIIHPSLSYRHVPSYKHIPKRKRSVNGTQSIRKLRSTANVKRIKQRNEVKKARGKARVVEILDQHLLDMLNKRRKKLARMASAATKVQTTQRRRLAQMQATQRKKLASAATTMQATQRKRSALATRRRLAEQEQRRKKNEEKRKKNEEERKNRKRTEIEGKLILDASNTNKNMINKVTKIQTARRMQQARRIAKARKKEKEMERIVRALKKHPPLKRYLETKRFPGRAINRTLNNPDIKRYLNSKILKSQNSNSETLVNIHRQASKLLSRLSGREKLLVKKLINDKYFIEKYIQTVPLSERGLKFAQRAGRFGMDTAWSIASIIGQGTKKGAEGLSEWHEQRQQAQRNREIEQIESQTTMSPTRSPRAQRPSRSPSPQPPPGFLARLRAKVKGGVKENDPIPYPSRGGPFHRLQYSPPRRRP